MNLDWIRPFAIRLRHGIVKNAPHMLMGLGTGSAVTSLIFAGKAGPKAQELIQTAECAKGEPLTRMETVKAGAPAWAPAGGMMLFALTCFWSAHGIDLKRQAILAGLYSTAEQALIEYQKKVVEMIGEKPEREIRNAVAQDHVNQNPPPSIVINEETDVWCYFRGQRFPSNMCRLKEIRNDVNWELIQHLYLSLADLYWYFDPARRYIMPENEAGSIGWSVDRLIDFDLQPVFDANGKLAIHIRVIDKDGREYLPQPGFSATL